MGEDAMSELSLRDRLRTALGHVLALPFLLFEFAIDWWYTRRWGSLVGGLPGVLAGLAVVGVSLKYSGTSPGEWARKYDAAGRSALGEGDLKAADVYFRRMTFLDESWPTGFYGLGVTAERQGDLTRARELMHRIAPETEAGYAPAHFWLAQDALRQKVPATRPTLQVLEHHLQQAFRSDAHQWEARTMAAQLYAATGQAPQAIKVLEPAAATRPEAQLELARLYALVGRTADSQRMAAKAGEFFGARTAAEPDQAAHRLRWASSELLQEHYENAVQVLAPGLSLATPEPFRQALCGVYLSWLETVSKQNPPNPARQLELLDLALQHDSKNPQALALLAALSTQQGEEAERAAALLNRVLAHGVAPAVVHLVLGTRAIQRGDSAAGLMHLEQAQRQNARIPEVLNNLAWGLAQKDKPDLERALQLAEAAQGLSSHPEIHDTLGTILVKLGRPREAVTHFERALRELPPRSDIHRQLGELYEQLGDAELAAEHRRRVQDLDARLAKERLPKK